MARLARAVFEGVPRHVIPSGGRWRRGLHRASRGAWPVVRRPPPSAGGSGKAHFVRRHRNEHHIRRLRTCSEDPCFGFVDNGEARATTTTLSSPAPRRRNEGPRNRSEDDEPRGLRNARPGDLEAAGVPWKTSRAFGPARGSAVLPLNLA